MSDKKFTFQHHIKDIDTKKEKDLFNGETIEYPIEFDIKIIVYANKSVADLIKAMKELMDSQKVPHSKWKHKTSSKGSYISLTAHVKIDSKKQMDSLYGALKQHPDVRMAL